MLDVFRIFFALFHGFDLLGRAAIFWNVIVGPDAKFQGAFFPIIVNPPRVIWFWILTPIALGPNDLNIAIIEKRRLGIVDIHTRFSIPHQNAAGRRNALGPTEIEEHSRHIEQVDAKVTRLAVAEFARITPAAWMDARVIITPSRRADIRLPIQS